MQACQHSRRLRESPAIFSLEQPPARNHQIGENLLQLALLSLKGLLISNLMGIMMFLIMLVGKEIHAFFYKEPTSRPSSKSSLFIDLKSANCSTKSSLIVP